MTESDNLSAIIDYSFSGSGLKTFECLVNSSDGYDSIVEEVNIQLLEVENYDILYSNVSNRIVSFSARNYYDELETNISISTNNEVFGDVLNISSNDDVIVIAEVNYSEAGSHEFNVSLEAGGIVKEYVENFKLEGVAIENYLRMENNYTTQVIAFDLVNKWNYGEVRFNVSNPSVSEAFNLSSDESVAVIIEASYEVQGNNILEVKGYQGTYFDIITDVFEATPLRIENFDALSDSVFEIHAMNKLDVSQNFSWALDSISSSGVYNITDDAFVIIEADYGSGVHEVNARVNSSSYYDTESEVIVK